jgi:hypothetical protein
MHGHSDCREEEKKSEFIKTNQTEFNNMVLIPQLQKCSSKEQSLKTEEKEEVEEEEEKEEKQEQEKEEQEEEKKEEEEFYVHESVHPE